MAGGLEIRAAHFPGRAPIDAYGNGGFRFADMSHRGSLLCLPSGIHGWNVESHEQISQESLSSILAEATDINLLLIGTGSTMLPVPATLRTYFRSAGIMVEAMSTGAAIRTFNVLLAEERAVAAALLAVD